MLLALPLVGSLLTINLALGILNRSAPQLTVFNIGFPTSYCGADSDDGVDDRYGKLLERLFSQGIGFMQALIEELAPLN